MALILKNQGKMSTSICKRFMPFRSRRYSAANSKGFKVTVIGAEGGNGQPLSMLLKTCPLVKKLALYDIGNAIGVAADVAHIDERADVVGYGLEKLPEALEDAHVVVITAGLPRYPNMTREAEFKDNAKIVQELSQCISACCPKACIVMISNPVNSLVPLAAKVMEKCGTYDPRRIFGATTIDSVRARKFVGDLLDVNPCCVSIPVIGGHSALTICPIISQSKPKYKAPQKAIEKLTEKIIGAGYAVVKAKNDVGCATLSMAYASFNLVKAILKGLNGEKGSKEYAFVPSNITEVSFFSSLVVMGKNGVETLGELPKMNEYEQDLYCKAISALKDEIKTGQDYVK